MKRLIFSVLTVLALVSGAFAQDMTKETVSGTVVSASSDLLVVDTVAGRMTFKLDSALDRMRYNDLRVGQQVQVTHRTDTNGTDHIVTDVTMLGSTPNTASSRPSNTYADNTTTRAGNTYTGERLPGTASGLTIAALLGLAALAAGLGIKKSRKSNLKAAR